MKYEDLDSPMIILKYFEEHPNEVVRPHKLFQRLPEEVQKEYKSNTFRKACAELEREGKISKIKPSDTKAFYGTKEAIDSLREQLENTSKIRQNNKRVKSLLKANPNEVYSYNEIMNELDITSQRRMIKREVQNDKGLDLLRIDNKNYFGTNKAISKLEDRIGDVI